MRFNFEEGKQRVIKMLEEHIIDFKTDMLQDIKGVLNEDREDTIKQIDDIIGSIKNNTLFVNIAIEGVREATTVSEVLDAMENTCFEETEERTILILFGLGENIVVE